MVAGISDVIFTCNDVFNGSILPFINVPVVFSLSPSELSDQFLLLPFAPVRWRLKKKAGGGRVFSLACDCYISIRLRADVNDITLIEVHSFLPSCTSFLVFSPVDRLFTGL